MPRLDWRIVAAATAILVVLGGGTLLAAQVEKDLDEGVDSREFDSPSQTPPLKLNEFRLPDDLAIDIPRGTEVSPDLSQIELPSDLDIPIPDDLDLSGLDFELPEDFQLELPEGTVFSPPGLELPNGATIRLPDGREFRIPRGSNLDLPPEMIERLLDAGIRPGELPSARGIDIKNLPPELTASLDPPQFDGAGRMTLPAGTTITLPDGRKFPFPAGAIPYAARYLLPEGTRIDLPFGADGSPGGAFPVPRPNSSTQLVDPTGQTRAATPMHTEITSLPSRVRKGEPIQVSGYVRDPLGRPVSGAPVDIFLNETKRTPGVLVGEGSSDASGTFVITVEIPADKPARDYQLVNHAVAFTDRSGRAWGDGWGDPPISTYASTALKLDLPARDGLGASTPIAGSLVDHTGAPVSGATIALSVDGAVVGRPTTSPLGRFTYPYSFSAGPHSVEARFLGSTSYEASAARGTITIDDFAIEVPATLRGKPGETILFSGRVLGKGAAAPERNVVLTHFDASVDLVSDSTGRFSYAYAIPTTLKPGLYQAQYALPNENVVKTQNIELNLTARLAIAAPASWDIDQPIPVTVTMTTTNGAPVDGELVRLVLSGPGGTSEAVAKTGSAGSIDAEISPLRSAPGAYTLTARPHANPYVDASAVSSSVTLGLFEVLWSVPSTVIRGEDASGALTVKFAGKPLSGAAVSLDFFGYSQLVTDENGRAAWTAPVPAGAPLGERVVSASLMDRPTRTTITSVAAIPELEIDAPSAFASGKPVQATLRLRDDQGAPMGDREIAIAAITPDGVTRTLVRTDARGEWSGPVDLGASRGENVTLNARFEPSDPYLGADSVQAMTAMAPPIAERNWILPAAIGLAAIVGGGTLYVVRKFPGKPKAVLTAAAPVAAAPARRAPDFDLSLAIPSDEPAVWGVGDPLALVVRNRGAPGEIVASWGAGSARVPLQGPEARTTLTFREEGEVVVEAEREGAPEMERARAGVRIVDYRKETAREFDLFLEKAQRLDALLTKRSTPREISWTLEMRLGESAKAHLDEIALVLEITNYSHYDVSREHYLRLVRAARALDPFFDERRGG